MSKRRSQGFGMIEVVVSILILAVISLSLVPVLVQSLRVSQLNSNLVAGNQFAADELDQLSSNVGTCSDLMFWVFDKSPSVRVFSSGITVEANLVPVDWDDCYGLLYPASVNVLVRLEDIESGDIVSSAYTLVNLGSE
jgi:prepilin-type N-terminal cleavage/methylation domain-containing protein